MYWATVYTQVRKTSPPKIYAGYAYAFVDSAMPTAGYAYAFVDLGFAFVDLGFAFVDSGFAFVNSGFAFVNLASLLGLVCTP
jgi:hypothetical protein